MDLLLQSRDRLRLRRTQRAERAQALVAMGEISSGRAALEGAPVPGNEATLNSLRNESRSSISARAPSRSLGATRLKRCFVWTVTSFCAICDAQGVVQQQVLLE